MSGKYTDLEDYLIQNKTIPENKWSHTALGQPPESFPGSYNIEDTDINLFHNLYNIYVFDQGNKAHLTERHKDVSPILIDLDLRHNSSSKKRHYTEDFIKKFTEIYFKELLKYVSGINKEYLKAFILEKDSPNYNGNKPLFKDGIHIMMPFIVTEPKIQYMIRYNLINNKEVIELFKSIKSENSIDDIIDIAVIEKNNWQMYGSCKPNHEAYKLKKIYHYDNTYLKQIEHNYSNKELLKILSIRKNKDIHIIKQNMFNDTLETDFTNIPKKQQSKKKKNIKKKKSPNKKKYVENDEELKFIKNLIKILNNNRSDSYNNWIRLGWCLHNIDHRLLEAWVEFSKRSIKFVEGECEKEWSDMSNDGLGLGTLYYWAQEDNLQKFKELSDNNLRKCMLNSLHLTPNDIAKVVYNLYKHEFVCICSKKNLWYQFQNHRWVLINDAVELRKRLSKELIDEYDKLDKYLADEIAKTEDDDIKDLKRKKKETISDGHI